MHVQLIRNDITKMQVDAIVTSSNPQLTPGSGVNGAIHRAAGPALAEECRTLGGCGTGQAKITRGYDLPCRWVIHTVGPVWRSGLYGEEMLLNACYFNSLQLAYRHGVQSIAFPLISSGAYGYPHDRAVKIAMNAIRAFLMECEEDMQVYLVVYSKEALAASSQLYRRVEQFIDDTYAEEHSMRRRGVHNIPPREAILCDSDADGGFFEDAVFSSIPCAPSSYGSLEEALDMLDESFSQMVLRKISEKGMTNAECYKKANLDKKLFSKINNDIHYKPKKTTALAFAIALELSLPEAKELLMKAGYALSRSDKLDIIVEYFISHKQYDIFELNEILYLYDITPLGNVIA